MNRFAKPVLFPLPKPIRIRLNCAWQPVAFVPKVRFIKPARPRCAKARFIVRRAAGRPVQGSIRYGWRR